mmetsp:Transcript_103218/g.332909  ORF Transcript_103218/g.332909 Transcript_103218/m.332909 type:complete len:204 (+) Transcript_103218:640-1251(+)
MLRQVGSAFSPGVDLCQGGIGAESPLDALSSRQAQGNARRCLRALGRQCQSFLLPLSLQLLLQSLLLCQQLLLLAALLLHEPLSFALLLLVPLLLFLSLPVHLQSLLVLQILLLPQLPVLHLLLAPGYDLCSVRLHLIQACSKERGCRVNLNVAIYGTYHADLVHAGWQEDAEPRVLARMQDLRHLVRLHPCNVATPENKIFV